MGALEDFPDDRRLWLTAYIEAFETLQDPEDLRNAGRLLLKDIRMRKEFFLSQPFSASCRASGMCPAFFEAGSLEPLIDLDEVRRRATPAGKGPAPPSR